MKLKYLRIYPNFYSLGFYEQEITQEKTKHQFRNLKKYTLYGVKVAVVDEDGMIGPFSSQIVVRTPEAGIVFIHYYNNIIAILSRILKHGYNLTYFIIFRAYITASQHNSCC